MNQLLQEHLFTIILFLLILILILIGILVFIIFKLLNDKNKQSVSNTSPTINIDSQSDLQIKNFENDKFNHLKKSEPIVEKYYCKNHTDQNSIGSCLICEDVFCEACLVEHEGMYFCRDHFKLFANNKWKQITDQKTTPESPEDGLYIWDFKRYIWKEKTIPSFVLTHYKINVEDDFIESYVQLNVEENRAEELSDELSKYKAKH